MRREFSSAQRTNENSPAIYRWDHVPNPNESVKRHSKKFSRPLHGLNSLIHILSHR